MIGTGDDGVDHINIYSKAKTELGRWLSNFAYSPIDLDSHGKFKSIEGYWYWLILYLNSSTDFNELREAYGFEAKKVGKELIGLYLSKKTKEENSAKTNTFKNFIKKAIDTKLKSNLIKLEELKQSSLPLVHYYEYGGKRLDAGYEWIVEHLEDRRSLLKDKW